MKFTLYHEICIRSNLPYGPKCWPRNEYLTQIFLANGVFSTFFPLLEINVLEVT